MKKIQLARVLSVGLLSVLVLSSFKTSNITKDKDNFLKSSEVINKKTSKSISKGPSSFISSYRVHADTYIFDQLAINDCNDAYESHVILFEDGNDLMIKKAVGLGNVILFWLAPEPVKKDVIIHTENQATKDYCECWIKNDPVWTVTREK